MGVLSPTIQGKSRERCVRLDGPMGSAERRTILYARRVCRGEGAAMCDEYYDARMKAFWRALAEADELENEEKEDEPIVKPIAIEPLQPVETEPRALGCYTSL